MKCFARRFTPAALVLAAALFPGRPALAQEARRKVEDLSAFVREYLGDVVRKEKFTVAVVSDTHYGADEGATRTTRRLLEDIAAAPVDFVVITGDVTEGKQEQAEELMALFEQVLGQRARLVAVMGNHDRAGKDVMDGLYGIDCQGDAQTCNYSFDAGRWHFTVVHDGQRALLDAANRRFLEADFSAAAKRPTLLLYHIHVLCPSPGQAHLSYMGQKRYEALEFLRRYEQVKGCFGGHDHAFWHGRLEGMNFLSTVGGWYQCGKVGLGWWRLEIDGERITAFRKEVGKPPTTMPAWEDFPPVPVARPVRAGGRMEVPLFADVLTGTGYYWGTQGQAAGPTEGVEPVTGSAMIRCTELTYGGDSVLGCEDFRVEPGDRLAYWMFVPPGCEQFAFGLRPGTGWKGFENLTDQNGLKAVADLKTAGVSPGNWLYREIPLGQKAEWFSTFTAAGPGAYARWPSANLHSSWRLLADEVRLLRGQATDLPAPDQVEGLSAARTGAACVVLEWKPVTGAHHYRVTRQDGGRERFIGTSREGRFHDFTVERKSRYVYRVSAVNAALQAGPAAEAAVTTAEEDPAPPKVAGLKGALLPKGRFVFSGTWHEKPAVHIAWDGKSDLNDLSVRAFRVYRLTDAGKELFAETIGRYAVIDDGKQGDRFAVSAVNHAGVEGPAAELEITQTWSGPGQAFHLRTGLEDSAR